MTKPKIKRLPTKPSDASLEKSALLVLADKSNIGDHEKIVYRIILEKGPISPLELEQLTGIRQIWSTVSRLRLRGMIKNAGRVHTDLGRETKAWEITGAPPAEYNAVKIARKALPRPSAHEVKQFANELAVIMAASHQKGARISIKFRKVHKWLSEGAACDCTKNR